MQHVCIIQVCFTCVLIPIISYHNGVASVPFPCYDANGSTPTHYCDNMTTDDDSEDDVTHQTCLVLWTWRKLADETNAKNTPKIC